jgi:hypothetical protein
MTFNKAMVIKYKYPIVGATLVLLLLSYLCWYFSDKQVVKRLVVGLSWDVSKEGPEGPVETALKMRNIKLVLAEVVALDVPGSTRYSESLASDMGILYLRHYRDRFDLLQPTLDKVLVTLPAQGEAVVQAKVQLQRQKRQEELHEVSASVEFYLKKEEGQWLLHKAVLPEILL